ELGVPPAKASRWSASPSSPSSWSAAPLMWLRRRAAAEGVEVVGRALVVHALVAVELGVHVRGHAASRDRRTLQRGAREAATSAAYPSPALSWWVRMMIRAPLGMRAACSAVHPPERTPMTAGAFSSASL